MLVNDLVTQALRKARTHAGGIDKTASSGKADPIQEAIKVADALEYMATEVHDASTPEGKVSRSALQEFFAKQAEKGGPAESVAPTGTQAVPPQAGARKILPTGLASGTHPTESGAPTGTQATIGQPPGGKEASAPRQTLLDVLTKRADGPSNSPTQSTASQDVADPGKKNENSNVDKILGSNAAPVAATKRDAKLPTRERLKALFASASDTGPSSAAAQAAFPQAYAKGGMKVAEAEPEKKPSVMRSIGKGALVAGGVGAGLGALGGGAVGSGMKLLAKHPAVVEDLERSGESAAKVQHALRNAGLIGAAGGAVGGAATAAPHGALLGGVHGAGQKKGYEQAKREDKTASLGDYAELFDKAASGELGDEAKAFAEAVEKIELKA